MTDQPPIKPKAKKAYSPPRMTAYGALRTLTRASTSGSAENSQGTGVMKPGSDRRVKERIVRVGSHPLGIGLYLFDYRPEFRDRWGHGRQFGVMADEVEAVVPDAVSLHESGYKVVDYALLGISRARH